MSRALQQRARACGVALSYRDLEGLTRRASRDTLEALVGMLDRDTAANELVEPVHVVWVGRGERPVQLRTAADGALRLELELELEDGTARPVAGTLPDDLPAGYHTLHVRGGGRAETSLVIAAPVRTYERTRRREWGAFLPLYAARSRHSWGIGDLGDAARLLEVLRDAGGAYLGTTPLLASFLDEPFEPSPYSPVSRLFWNEAFVDPERIPELEPGDISAPEVGALRDELQQLRHVDYRRVMQLKRRLLEAGLARMLAQAGARREEFERFREQPQVARYSEFRARVEQRGHGPAPAGAACHQYAQFCMREQLEKLAGDAAGQLYLDLPLGVHPQGFDVREYPDLFVAGAQLGAPPDPLGPLGQQWGLPPLHPQAQREQRHAYTIACLRELMRYAGVLRIDHVMGLHRQYWIPEGMPASAGAYVTYPAEELWAIVCLESHRSGTVIVGEDLGTVPPAVRAAMRRHGALRTYLLQFALDPQREPALEAPPARSMASLNSHDTIPFAAWLDRLSPEQHAALMRHLRERNMLDATQPSQQQLTDAVQCDLAASGARMLTINLEDLWGEREPQNVPGTSNEHPNWQRRAARSVEEIARDGHVAATLARITQARRRRAPRPLTGATP